MDRERAWLTESTLSSGEDVNLFSVSVIDNSYSYIFVCLTYFNYWGGVICEILFIFASDNITL